MVFNFSPGVAESGFSGAIRITNGTTENMETCNCLSHMDYIVSMSCLTTGMH